MRGNITLEKIQKEIETSLTPQEQLKLMEKLAHKLGAGLSEKKKLDWSHLYGLGKNLWQGEDAQEYVNRLREDR